jgi:hypothetical protein
VLDRTATRLVTLALRAEANRRPDATADLDAHHALARRVAASAAVLCRNEVVDGAPALPVRDGDRVALLGAFATRPRFQGTGSSRITPTRVDRLHDELVSHLGADRVSFAPGYDAPDEVDDRLLADAVARACEADVAVVVVGLPDGYENEGDDRAHLDLPRSHDALVAAVAAAHDRVVVVVIGGAPVVMPWVDDVEAVVVGYLGGQAGGGGLADVLSGAATPGGHLAETFPRHLADLPTARSFPGGPTTVEHRESVYVGYRFHDTVGGEVLFPFGHGLSYTTFDYGEVSLDRTEVAPDDLAGGSTVTASVEVTNTGEVAGSHVVQCYVRDVASAVHRPDRELRAFARIHLEVGASTTVELELGERAFAFWDVEVGGWTVEPGAFEVLVGASSRDLRGSATLSVHGRGVRGARRTRGLPRPAAVPRRRRGVVRGAARPAAARERRLPPAVHPGHADQRDHRHGRGPDGVVDRRPAAAQGVRRRPGQRGPRHLDAGGGAAADADDGRGGRRPARRDRRPRQRPLDRRRPARAPSARPRRATAQLTLRLRPHPSRPSRIPWAPRRGPHGAASPERPHRRRVAVTSRGDGDARWSPGGRLPSPVPAHVTGAVLRYDLT